MFSLCRIKQEVPSQEVLEQEMVWMKEHLSNLGSPVVLCHNDLLCKNIIHNRKEGRPLLARYATVAGVTAASINATAVRCFTTDLNQQRLDEPMEI